MDIKCPMIPATGHCGWGLQLSTMKPLRVEVGLGRDTHHLSLWALILIGAHTNTCKGV